MMCWDTVCGQMFSPGDSERRGRGSEKESYTEHQFLKDPAAMAVIVACVV